MPDTYRGWTISFDFPPIPRRDWDWSATHPDYDGSDDSDDNRFVTGATRGEVINAIDEWYIEMEKF